MKTSHWDSNVPAGSRAKATRFLPTSAAAPFPSAHLGKPWKAFHSAARSVFFILEEATNFNLKAPFSLKKYGFPSLLLLMFRYLTANKNHKIEFLARDKSPVFIMISVWITFVPPLGVWSHTGLPLKVWKSVCYSAVFHFPCKNTSLLQRTHKYFGKK